MILYYIVLPIVWVLIHILWRIEVIGLDRVPRDRPVVLAPNHISDLDPVFVLGMIFDFHRYRILAKKELFQNPILRWFLRKVGAFPVDREGSDVQAMKTAMKCLQEGDKLLLFPEGTRVQSEGDASAKGGAVMFATRTGVPMIPIYCGEKHKFFRRSRVVFGEPYMPQWEGRRPTAEENHQFAEELLRRIYALKK